MSEESDYLYALEMQRQLNGSDGESDIEEIVDFKPPPPAKKPLQIKRSNPHSNLDEDFLNRTQNLVHPQWETLDPTPDVFALFGAFDAKFFQSRLKCVTLEWSKRMYSCAGICYSRRNRLGMEITIRLSEPLLKLRPRKDLVETMLHEMIHAYCFVLNIREGNGGHGPNFKKIMYSINKVAGTNITVYHTFHDEVNVYKQHWWRCNGSCQNRSPFFGYVKRTSNRAPGPNDQWWAAHLESCGGTFMKIKEPEKPKKEKSSKSKSREKKLGNTSGGADMRKFFPPQTDSQNPKISASTTANSGRSNINGFGSLNKGGFQGPIKTNGGGTMLLDPKTTHPSLTYSSSAKPTGGPSSIASAFPPSSYPGLSSDPFNSNLTASGNNSKRISNLPAAGNLINVRGFRDLNNSDAGSGNAGRIVSGFKTTPKESMQGRGYSLSGSGSSSTSVDKSTRNDGQVDRNHLRDVWAKRFGAGGNSACSDDALSAREKNIRRNERNKSPEGDSKRRRLSNDATDYIANEVQHVANMSNVQTSSNTWVIVDDDIMLQDKPEEIIALSSDSDSDDADVDAPTPLSKPIKLTADQRQNAIKQEILDESMDTVLTNDDIELIDDDYNDDEDLLNTSAAIELADTSIIDDFFGEDTLLKEFKRENDVFPSGSRSVPNPDNDIITCPICQGKMKRSVFAEHLDGCTGIAVKILPRKQTLKKLSTTSKQLNPTRRRTVTKESAKDILRKAGYSEQDLANITSTSSADEEEEFLSSSGLSTSSPARPSATSQIADLNSSGECDESTRRYRQRNLFKTTRQCPVCAQEIEEDEMNEHLDECLHK